MSQPSLAQKFPHPEVNKASWPKSEYTQLSMHSSLNSWLLWARVAVMPCTPQWAPSVQALRWLFSPELCRGERGGTSVNSAEITGLGGITIVLHYCGITWVALLWYYYRITRLSQLILPRTIYQHREGKKEKNKHAKGGKNRPCSQQRGKREGKGSRYRGKE